MTELRWDEPESEWIVTTDRGDRMRARFVVTAGGTLSQAKLPGIPGIETFQGHTFHTSRWDYAYTGGDADGNLHRLADKRVALIGTGATAIQCVPHLGRGRPAPVRVPAHAFLGRRTRQPPHGPGLGRFAHAGLAATAHGQLPHPGHRRTGGRGPGRRRLDQQRPAPAKAHPHRQLPAAGARGAGTGLRASRLPADERDPRPRRHPRRGPGDGRTAQALVPVHVQAAHFQRQLPADVQPPQRHRSSTRPTPRAWSASPRTPSSSADAAYEVDCVIFATGFEVGRLGNPLRTSPRRTAGAASP